MRLPILSEEAFNALDRWVLLSEYKKREQCCESGVFLTLDPGSGIRNRFFSYPGSRITDHGSQTHIFDNLMTNCWVKRTIILSVLAKKIIFTCSKIKGSGMLIPDPHQ